MIELIKKIFFVVVEPVNHKTHKKKNNKISIVRRSQGVAKIKKKQKPGVMMKQIRNYSPILKSSFLLNSGFRRRYTNPLTKPNKTTRRHKNLTVSSKPPWPAL